MHDNITGLVSLPHVIDLIKWNWKKNTSNEVEILKVVIYKNKINFKNYKIIAFKII